MRKATKTMTLHMKMICKVENPNLFIYDVGGISIRLFNFVLLYFMTLKIHWMTCKGKIGMSDKIIRVL